MVAQRNLIAFVYPRSTGHWRRAVRHLMARWSQFDGVRAVAIATDASCDDPAEVEAEFGDGVRFHVCRNTPLQEIQPFAWLLEQVIGQPGITLYAHAKGASHDSPDAASHVWCDVMASACLDYPDLVDCALSAAPCAGAFRSRQRVGGSSSPFHFAGTWWWVDNAALRARNWGHFEQVFWGVESYLGQHFQPHESSCLFFDGAETAHLYHHAWWDAHILPAYRRWRLKLSGCGLRPLAQDPPVTDRVRGYLA